MNLVNFEYDFAKRFHIKLANVQRHSIIKLRRKITYGHIDHPTLNLTRKVSQVSLTDFNDSLICCSTSKNKTHVIFLSAEKRI